MPPPILPRIFFEAFTLSIAFFSSIKELYLPQRYTNFIENMQIIDVLLMIPLILGGYIGFQNGLFETAGKLLAALISFSLTVLSLHYLERILLHFFASALTGYGKIFSFILT